MTRQSRSSSRGSHADAEPLAGRTALITGASRGIGAATARRLAGAGARVFLLARSREALEALASSLGGTALVADLADSEALEAAVRRLRAEIGGPPDVVVGAAGVFTLDPLARTDPEDLDRNLAVNLRGTFLLLRVLLPAMLERGEGHVVNVGSVAGRRALPGNAAYAASKFGLRGMHEVLVEELRGTGVRATLLEPSATDTSIWDPMDPDSDPGLPDREGMLRPDDVAQAVLFAVTRPPDVQVPLLQIERA